ncbi:MAG TPA: Gfo/Idh/MocA family oxidoreductase [Clostridia bacterium]|nr:Gfo/Idh/MocA family oxidoreductase [Clostridia bacterium]
MKYIQIGTGGFGEYWCKAVYPGIASVAQPVAAVDVNEAALENAVKLLGLAPDRCYADARRAMRENRADFAVIVVPPQFHEQMIDLALENGMDVVCEKPLAESMEACCRIYRKVKAAGARLTVTMSHRFEVEKQTVEALVRGGHYGKPNYIVGRLTMRRTGGKAFRADAPESLIPNALIHQLDTVRGIARCNAQTVYADCWPFFPEEERDGAGLSAFAQVVMENGVRACLEASFANATTLNKWSDEYLRVECAQATIVADRREVGVYSHLGYPWPAEARMHLLNQEHWDHALIVRQFVRWISGGEAPPTCLEDNLQCCALVYAAVESARSHTAVHVQDFLKRHMEMP